VESWLTVGNGRTGTRGSLEARLPQSRPGLYVAGVFGCNPDEPVCPELVRGPEWTALEVAVAPTTRTLDLRQGVLFSAGPGFCSARFASLDDRQVLVLLAEGASPGVVPVPTVEAMVDAVDAVATERGAHIRMQGRGGQPVWFAASTAAAAGRVTRLVAVDRDGPAHDALTRAESAGAGTLLARHRRAWRERWQDADVVVDGDALAQRDLRFALYHLIISGDPESDRASVGARSLSGPGYRGHVFWDTEVFVLPFFIWTHPETARALLAYRHRTLPGARAKAVRLGYAGALYAWESADTGEETTPEEVLLPDGTPLKVLTGLLEHHISADVAWAVWQYWRVTGDDAFVETMGAEIVVETARFWASRANSADDGRLHVCDVIGPDEYHEGVDDNAYTNVMAQWNLRAAGAVCDRFPEVADRLNVTAEEREDWLRVATDLFVPFDAGTGLYEQFEGFFALENIRSVDLAPRPFTGEMVVGVDRLRRTQVVKQADVLMLGVLLPDQIDLDVQTANYRYYEPRTSHGSSLSPAMHALVAARVGDLDEALAYFHLAGGVDLDNRMGNAAEGVHIATMGGLWQAAVFGFGGVRVDGDAVRIDPRIPPAWTGLRFPIRWRGTRIAVTVEADMLELELDGPALVAVGTGPAARLDAGVFVSRRQDGVWSAGSPA
jgi:trehalose/maltose hydrolase-like predicted phosphorylase